MEKSLAYIDYYIGAYGDTLRISTQQKDWIVLFQKQIENILNGKMENFDFCKMQNLKRFDNIASLELIKVVRSSIPCIFFECRENTNYFKWLQDIDDLKNIIYLLNTLIESNSPCHQYLEGNDNKFTFEFCYNEDTDAFFEKAVSPYLTSSDLIKYWIGK